jgi:hypothetical protein
MTPLLAAPATVTTTGPEATPAGTGATMPVSPQLVGVAMTPLKATVLVPCVAPKLVPVTVTDVPTGPEAGVKLLIFGVTVKVTPLLTSPLLLTTTDPVDAPVGTVAMMLVAPQLAGLAATPLKVRVLLPCVAPKFVPVTVTDVPMAPEVGERLLIVGWGTGDGIETMES